MFRWVRLAAVGALVVSLVAVGVGFALFYVANDTWVAVDVPPRLTGVLGKPEFDFSVPALIAGWLVSVLTLTTVVVGSMYYVWRRRQYESLISKLESELTELRNLPFKAPAPLEDLPEEPNPEAALLMAQTENRSRHGDSERRK